MTNFICFLLLKCCVIIVYMFSQWVHVKVSLKHCGGRKQDKLVEFILTISQKVNKKKILRSFNNSRVSLFFKQQLINIRIINWFQVIFKKHLRMIFLIRFGHLEILKTLNQNNGTFARFYIYFLKWKHNSLTSLKKFKTFNTYSMMRVAIQPLLT